MEPAEWLVYFARVDCPFSKRSRPGFSADCDWSVLPDICRVQGDRAYICVRRRISILDQPVFGGRGLSVHGPGAAQLCFAARYGDRVNGGGWRIGDWTGAGFGSVGASGQRGWSRVYVDAAVLVELPGGACGVLAILRGFAGPFGVCRLLRDLDSWEQRGVLVMVELARFTLGEKALTSSCNDWSMPFVETEGIR